MTYSSLPRKAKRPRRTEPKPRLPGDGATFGQQQRKRRPGLAARSKKRATDERYYAALRRVWLGDSARPCASEGCRARATEVHHGKGRVGSLLCDVRWWLALCGPCHRFVTLHPGEAFEMGLSYHRNNTTKEPPTMPTADKCRSCEQPIKWVTTVADKSMPLDADDQGDGVVIEDNMEAGRIIVDAAATAAAGSPRYRSLKKGEMNLDGGPILRSHFVTCPEGPSWRKG